ncbi:unnamed protein product [Pleuronectes platessa]|uniref:Uncharacterized protein n=1 Tax=Pleuronectes platessa TaxID=8262 RepID=A0A9N7Y0Y5_PLEPL|nr:unnamed protein product [Pleuronectes platessa]
MSSKTTTVQLHPATAEQKSSAQKQHVKQEKLVETNNRARTEDEHSAGGQNNDEDAQICLWVKDSSEVSIGSWRAQHQHQGPFTKVCLAKPCQVLSVEFQGRDEYQPVLRLGKWDSLKLEGGRPRRKKGVI